MVEFWLRKFWLKFGCRDGWKLSRKDKFWFVLNLVVAILIIWFVIHNLVGDNLVENCWDQYSTEHEAILNCEK